MNTFSFVVPGNALTEVERICADCDDEVIVTLGDRHVTFQVGQTLLVSGVWRANSSIIARPSPKITPFPCMWTPLCCNCPLTAPLSLSMIS